MGKENEYIELIPMSEIKMKKITKQEVIDSVDVIRVFINKNKKKESADVWKAFSCLKELSYRQMNIYD